MVHGHAVTQLMAYYTCPLSTCTSHAHILYLSKGHNPDEIRALSWNIMGDTGTGWAEARKKIVPDNIRGYDIVFLQEVQWAESYVKKYLAAPAGYEFAITKSATEIRNVCILYNPEKLKCEDAKLVNKIMTVTGWTDIQFQRVCIQVFALHERGKTSKFVAIGVHANNDVYINEAFCRLLKITVEKISEVQGPCALPIILGGDFNSDIRYWKIDSVFLGLMYETDRNPIDFITLKPTRDSHLEMAEVRVTQYSEIKILREAQELEVQIEDREETGKKKKKIMLTVAELKREYGENTFFRYLCGGHRPLTVVVHFNDATVTRITLQEEVAELAGQVKKLGLELQKSQDRIRELKEEKAQLKRQLQEQ